MIDLSNRFKTSFDITPYIIDEMIKLKLVGKTQIVISKELDIHRKVVGDILCGRTFKYYERPIFPSRKLKKK